MTVELPERPKPRIIAFDESIEIRGYSKQDMDDYAMQAVLFDRQRRQNVFCRIWRAIRG